MKTIIYIGIYLGVMFAIISAIALLIFFVTVAMYIWLGFDNEKKNNNRN